MVKTEIKEEPVEKELEMRYREDPPEIDNNEQYYQVGSISDQVQAIWDEEEVKPKVEQIGIDPNRQVVINLDRDLIRKNYRDKWIEHVLSTYRHRKYVKACQLCPQRIIFDSPSKLIEHYKEFHQKDAKRYDCAVCYFSTKHQKTIIHHWESHHKYGHKHKIGYTYQKRREPLTTEKYAVSRRPIDPNNIWIGDDELVHSMFFKEPFECDICLKIFSENYLLNNHKTTIHLEENEIKKWYKCDQCNKRFRMKQSLRIHLKYVHKEKVSCVFCSKQYSSHLQLRKHERIHRNDIFTCEFCDMKFIDKQAQYIHYRKLHFVQLRQQDKLNGGLNRWFQGSRTYECYRCRFTDQLQIVKKHMEKLCKFQGNRPIDCVEENCIRRFDTIKLMKNHYKRTHDKTLDFMHVPQKRRTFECHICRYTKKGFNFFVLRKHLREEHPKEIKCDICNATFSTWDSLKKHILIHGEKTFKCKYCPKRFNNIYNARRHEKIHEKPIIDPLYKCDQCQNTYHEEEKLRKHKENSHRGEFSCVFCPKKYSYLSQLRLHERSHRNEMFTCEFCGMKFIEKRFQYIHYRKLHFGQLRKQDKFNGGLNRWFQGGRTYECYRCRFTDQLQSVKKHMEKLCKFQGNSPIDCVEENCIRRFDTSQQMKTHYKRTHDKTLDFMHVHSKK